MNSSRHLTTRRGFVATLGFGGVSLYGLWVRYGAAPDPLALFRNAGAVEDPMAADDGSMAGHGMGHSGPSLDEFRATVADFVDRFGQPDGSVFPQRQAEGAMTAMPMDATMPGMVMATDPAASTMDDHHTTPIDVYLLAEKWFYEPSHLRLEAGTPYRFKMMAADVPHGASVQFGQGARMIRLQPGSVTEVALTFDRPGGYLIYCTAYCGAGHDAMQARIDVI
ncbi:MAG: hypothetical protein Q8Q26_07615 [Pseudorhodobacter sp.]|nr:hypothetical protein [Pseudorhodobacter sp.]